MPGAPQITFEQAAKAIVAVEEFGYSQKTAAELADISRPSVSDILNGKYRWGELLESPVFNKLRLAQKRAFQVATFELSRKSLIQADSALPKASYLQAVTGYAILRDKERLDAGEPTEISMSYQVTEFRGIDQLAEALARSLVSNGQENPNKSKEIEVKAEESKASEKLDKSSI